ncbi:hypothetical protein FOMPIDRAFT_94533 [Fomitopsis schrenkii]|uniref:Uncharacterized protein n=1 Tax=Fomitopsis schrenkii TaxID=2126942 RepID=S8ESN4_FOMSC|nr:hypothetical protein FOMPIDRAFT_94533 [Fomitopsis schrenkii]
MSFAAVSARINTDSVFHSGIVVTVVCGLVVSSLSLLYALGFRPKRDADHRSPSTRPAPACSHSYSSVSGSSRRSSLGLQMCSDLQNCIDSCTTESEGRELRFRAHEPR